MVFFTQITMEAAEDTEFLDAMQAANSWSTGRHGSCDTRRT